MKMQFTDCCMISNHFLSGPSRFKGFNFQEAGLSFELSEQLAVSDIAVQILHTRYDHLSPLVRMIHLRTHTPVNRCYYCYYYSYFKSSHSDTNTFTMLTSNTFCLFLYVSIRSFAGVEDVFEKKDQPEQTIKTRELKEDNDTQEQPKKIDEETQSLQGLGGRKVRRKTELLLWVPTFSGFFHSYSVCISQSAASMWSRSNSLEPEESHVQTQMEALGGKMTLQIQTTHTI